MATRWIVPCGCELVYDMDGENVLIQSFTPCPSHQDVTIENAHASSIAYCQQLAALQEEPQGD
jgi:hypothetical protein